MNTFATMKSTVRDIFVLLISVCIFCMAIDITCYFVKTDMALISQPADQKSTENTENFCFNDHETAWEITIAYNQKQLPKGFYIANFMMNPPKVINGCSDSIWQPPKI